MEHSYTVPVFTLGDRLRKARESTGMTQSDMANRLGIGRRSVSRYEDGIHTPKAMTVMAWAMATGVPYDWLATGQLPANVMISECYPGLPVAA
jgi:transcriptional regulator with XRE-family HTH domain